MPLDEISNMSTCELARLSIFSFKKRDKSRSVRTVLNTMNRLWIPAYLISFSKRTIKSTVFFYNSISSKGTNPEILRDG